LWVDDKEYDELIRTLPKEFGQALTVLFNLRELLIRKLPTRAGKKLWSWAISLFPDGTVQFPYVYIDADLPLGSEVDVDNHKILEIPLKELIEISFMDVDPKSWQEFTPDEFERWAKSETDERERPRSSSKRGARHGQQ
jgi:hypothetical protein